MEEQNTMSIDAIETLLEEQPETTWFPQTPSQADWCIKMINDAKAMKKRIDDIADEEIEVLKARKESQDAKYDSQVNFFTSKLRQYFESLDASDVKETKTQYKHSLLNGSLVMTKPKKTMEKSDEELLAYLELNRPEFVKVERKPVWGEFKKTLEIVGENVIDRDTGDVVDCISIVESEEKFEVK